MKDCRKTMFKHLYYNLYIPPIVMFDLILNENNKNNNIKLINTDRKIMDDFFIEDIINNF